MTDITNKIKKINIGYHNYLDMKIVYNLKDYS